MTVLERKARFISAIITDMNEDRFVETEKFYTKLQKCALPISEPCMYTVEEIKSSISQQITDFESGVIKLIPHEQIERKSVQ